MPYFDSQKNRALWAKELAELKKEKEARKEGKSRAAEAKLAEEEQQLQVNTVMQSHSVLRERTSYKELLYEEQMSINAMKVERMTQKQKERTTEMDMSAAASGRK